MSKVLEAHGLYIDIDNDFRDMLGSINELSADFTSEVTVKLGEEARYFTLRDFLEKLGFYK
ncbi:MAG: hypothetical protein KAS32_18680 [Candidatus Peribacteraceae bacterium]|nr:hypothetical protein [Candidatus Peribacteraceae bacterium]